MSSRLNLLEQIRMTCNRLGKYRQLFCFGLLHLFDESGNLIWDRDTEESATHTGHMELIAARGNSFLHLYLSEKEIKVPLRLQSSYHKKLKALPASCVFQAQILPSSAPVPKKTVRLDSSGVQVTQKKRKKITNKVSNTLSSPDFQTTIQREIYRFPSVQPDEPNSFFVNNLYIYPRRVDLSSTTARNISIRIELRDNDKTVDQKGLPVSIQNLASNSTAPGILSTPPECIQ